MVTSKKIILWIVSLIFVGFVIYIGVGIFNYFEFKKIAKATGGLPWQDGGVIVEVSPPCLSCFDPLTDCAECCPVATEYYGPLCVRYTEIYTNSQLGTEFVLVPIDFGYAGGGSFPQQGMQYIGGGASNILVYVVGISKSVATGKIYKIVDWFDYIIAGIKKN